MEFAEFREIHGTLVNSTGMAPRGENLAVAQGIIGVLRVHFRPGVVFKHKKLKFCKVLGILRNFTKILLFHEIP